MAKSKKPGGGDYEVGYRKPPPSSRFKLGQSGNPGGRKKHNLNLSTVLEEVLGQTIEISENGKKQVVTIQKALMLRWVQEGLKGNVRAIEGICDRKQRIELAPTAPDQSETAEDAALLRRYVQAQVEAAIAKLMREASLPSEHAETEGNQNV